MTIQSTVGSALNSLLGIDDGAVNTAHNNLDAYLKSGAIQNAASLGPYAPGYAAGAQQIANTNVQARGLDPNTQAALDAARDHYLAQFQHGGLRSKAAVEAAQQQAAMQAQGGAAGVQAQIAHSAALQQGVSQTSTADQGEGAQQTTNLEVQKAQMALQQALFAAQVSHANTLKNLGANQVSFDLGNDQAYLNNQAQGALIEGQGDETALSQQQQAYDAKTGASILQMLLLGGGGLAGTALSAFGNSKAAPVLGSVPTDSSASSPITVNTGETYQLPAPRVGTQSPVFSSLPTLPTTANDWLGRTGT